MSEIIKCESSEAEVLDIIAQISVAGSDISTSETPLHEGMDCLPFKTPKDAGLTVSGGIGSCALGLNE